MRVGKKGEGGQRNFFGTWQLSKGGKMSEGKQHCHFSRHEPEGRKSIEKGEEWELEGRWRRT